MRGPCASIVGALLLVAAQAPAAEDTAPLESTRQELRQLESTQKNKVGEATAGSVKMSTPALEVQSAEGNALRSWNARQKKEERQRQQQQQREAGNWLVNGVEQLGKEGTKAGATPPGEPAAMSESDTLTTPRDSSDPQYLLKLYDEQKKLSDPKEATARTRSAPAPDPFAPFLQNWLGTSPVRDQVMDQFKKGNEAGVSPVASGGGATDFRTPAVVSSGSTGTAWREPAGQAKPNPYLAELNAPIPPRDVLAGASAMSALDQSLSSGTAPAMAPVTTPMLDPLPDSRPPAKGPPPGLTDDKKYFPQLKKF